MSEYMNERLRNYLIDYNCYKLQALYTVCGVVSIACSRQPHSLASFSRRRVATECIRHIFEVNRRTDMKLSDRPLGASGRKASRGGRQWCIVGPAKGGNVVFRGATTTVISEPTRLVARVATSTAQNGIQTDLSFQSRLLLLMLVKLLHFLGIQLLTNGQGVVNVNALDGRR